MISGGLSEVPLLAVRGRAHEHSGQSWITTCFRLATAPIGFFETKLLRMKHHSALALAVWLLLDVAGGPAFAQENPAEEPQATSDQSQAERLAAERREKAQNLTPARVSSGEARMRGIEKSRFPFSIFQQGFHGFRPVTGGMPSGSGFVVGGGYVRGLESEVFTVSADARYSTRGFKQADVRLALPTAQSGRPIKAFVNASYQDYPGLRFFGLGNDSGSEDRVFFGQKNEIFGGGVTAESRWVDLSVEANRMTIETGSANRDPSVEAVFPVIQDPSVAPLFGTRTDYNVVGGAVTLNLVDRYNYPRVGLWLTAEGWRYDDQDLDRFSFTRVVGHLRGQIPLGTRNRRLAFQLRTSYSTADSGNEVPIYSDGDARRREHRAWLQRIPLSRYAESAGQRRVSLGGLDLYRFCLLLRRR